MPSFLALDDRVLRNALGFPFPPISAFSLDSIWPASTFAEDSARQMVHLVRLLRRVLLATTGFSWDDAELFGNFLLLLALPPPLPPLPRFAALRTTETMAPTGTYVLVAWCCGLAPRQIFIYAWRLALSCRACFSGLENDTTARYD